eukprot:m.89800 g.89800  ORF g.89800 m.89800 type:complete len:125 (-) comp14986_c1_seq2:131-505(-)
MALVRVPTKPDAAEIGDVRWTEPDVSVYVGDQTEAPATGTLYVAEGLLLWWSAEEQRGLTVEYPCITLHAVSTDALAFPVPCLYCQLQPVGDDEAPTQEDEDTAGMPTCCVCVSGKPSLTQHGF